MPHQQISRSILFGSVLAILASAPSLTRAEWPTELNSLRPAFRALCASSPEISVAKSSVQIQSERASVRSKYFIPRLDAVATAGLRDPSVTNTFGPFGSGTRGSAGITAELLLNPFFGASLEAQRAKLELEKSEVSAVVVQQEQAVRLFDLLLSASALYSRDQDFEDTKQRLERQYKTLGNSVRQGLAKRRDLQQFEAELLRLEEQRHQLKRSVVETRERLNVLLGDGPIEQAVSGLRWQALLRLVPEKIESIEESPELRATKLKSELSQLDRRLSEKRTGLVTSLQATYAMQNSDIAPDWSRDSVGRPWSSTWFAGLTLKYPLWDNGVDALTRRESAQAETDASVELRQADRDFQAKKRLLADEYTRLSERRTLAERLVALERQSFEQVALDYREGRSGYLEWISANQSLQGAVKAQIELASDWARYWMRVQQLRGDLANEVCR